jgi:hypothetical protein
VSHYLQPFNKEEADARAAAPPPPASAVFRRRENTPRTASDIQQRLLTLHHRRTQRATRCHGKDAAAVNSPPLAHNQVPDSAAACSSATHAAPLYVTASADASVNVGGRSFAEAAVQGKRKHSADGSSECPEVKRLHVGTAVAADSTAAAVVWPAIDIAVDDAAASFCAEDMMARDLHAGASLSLVSDVGAEMGTLVRNEAEFSAPAAALAVPASATENLRGNPSIHYSAAAALLAINTHHSASCVGAPATTATASASAAVAVAPAAPRPIPRPAPQPLYTRQMWPQHAQWLDAGSRHSRLSPAARRGTAR